jgi:hypothetical protein
MKMIKKLIMGFGMALLPCFSYASHLYTTNANNIQIGTLDSERLDHSSVAFKDELKVASGSLSLRLDHVAIDTTTLKTRIDNLDSSTATLTNRLNAVATDTSTLKTRSDNFDTWLATSDAKIQGLELFKSTGQSKIDSWALSQSTISKKFDLLNRSTEMVRIDIVGWNQFSHSSYTFNLSVASAGLFQFDHGQASGNWVVSYVVIGTGTDTVDPTLDFVVYSTGTMGGNYLFSAQIATGTIYQYPIYFTVSGTQRDDKTLSKTNITLTDWKTVFAEKQHDAKIKFILTTPAATPVFFKRATLYHPEYKLP